METKNQFIQTKSRNEQQITKVEKIFVASFQEADVLFVKPENQKLLALELPNGFLAALMTNFEKQN